MKRHNVFGWKGAAEVIVIMMWAMLAPAYCQTPSVTLLIQQSPVQGGTTAPSPGVYDLASNSEVPLTAISEPGYEFVYWLGDVADPMASTTFTYLNKPKIIIAVFQQTEYEFPITELSMSGGSRSSLSAGGSGGGGGISVPIVLSNPPIPLEQPQSPKPPIIPEPATGLLLVLGTLAALRKRTA